MDIELSARGRQALLGRAGRLVGSMSFCSTATAVSAKLQVARRKLLIFFFSLRFAACAQALTVICACCGL